jgi:5-methylcytosine-specific restriction endonuclease McrA
MNSVFVLGNTFKPLMPTRPARANRLLKAGKAVVYRLQPFTIILKYRSDGITQPIELKVDPGSKTTGIAFVGDFIKQGRIVLWAANLSHRGHVVKARLDKRRMLRRGRRSRKLRYRPARWLNRANSRRKKIRQPSLLSRIDNIKVWQERLTRYAPITSIAVETNRFDTQKIQEPEISGIEYQQGELLGYEIREYLLEKFNRTCVYCGKKNLPLEIDHVIPKSKGGSDRVSNLTLACHSCNQTKGKLFVEEFLKDKPEILKRIKSHLKKSLKDAAIMNAIRYIVGNILKDSGLPTTCWSGGRTKKNRVSQGYRKEHWIDAACVGETGENVSLVDESILNIKAMGRGQRQVVRVDKYGFPKGKPGRIKRVHGFQTGDLVKLTQPKGKYIGTYFGRLSGIRARGDFDIKTTVGKITSNYKNFKILQRNDGYEYSVG